MSRRPILTVTIKGRVHTGRTALAKKIQQALTALGIEVNINDPDHVLGVVDNYEVDEILQDVNALVNIEFEQIKVTGANSDEGFVTPTDPTTPAL